MIYVLNLISFFSIHTYIVSDKRQYEYKPILQNYVQRTLNTNRFDQFKGIRNNARWRPDISRIDRRSYLAYITYIYIYIYFTNYLHSRFYNTRHRKASDTYTYYTCATIIVQAVSREIYYFFGQVFAHPNIIWIFSFSSLIFHRYTNVWLENGNLWIHL